MKISKAPKELHEFYDRYIKEKGITDKKEKRKIYWAMLYCAKEGHEWVET